MWILFANLDPHVIVELYSQSLSLGVWGCSSSGGVDFCSHMGTVAALLTGNLHMWGGESFCWGSLRPQADMTIHYRV